MSQALDQAGFNWITTTGSNDDWDASRLCGDNRRIAASTRSNNSNATNRRPASVWSRWPLATPRATVTCGSPTVAVGAGL